MLDKNLVDIDFNLVVNYFNVVRNFSNIYFGGEFFKFNVLSFIWI